MYPWLRYQFSAGDPGFELIQGPRFSSCAAVIQSLLQSFCVQLADGGEWVQKAHPLFNCCGTIMTTFQCSCSIGERWLFGPTQKWRGSRRGSLAGRFPMRHPAFWEGQHETSVTILPYTIFKDPHKRPLLTSPASSHMLAPSCVPATLAFVLFSSPAHPRLRTFVFSSFFLGIPRPFPG